MVWNDIDPRTGSGAPVYAKEKITSGEDVSGPKIASARQAAFGGGLPQFTVLVKEGGHRLSHKHTTV